MPCVNDNDSVRPEGSAELLAFPNAPWQLSRFSTLFRNHDLRIHLNPCGELLLLARRPRHLDRVNLCSLAQAEIKRHRALREVTGLSIIVPGVGPRLAVDLHGGSQSIAIGLGPD